jgi:hypothetical protein
MFRLNIATNAARITRNETHAGLRNALPTNCSRAVSLVRRAFDFALRSASAERLSGLQEDIQTTAPTMQNALPMG